MNPHTDSEKPDADNSRPQEHRNNTGASPAVSLWLIGAFCFVLAFSFLLIASKSSPLYPFNDWSDANAFFTMGKGMINGRVPYRDLFEQKGPLLYFIYGLGYLVSNTTFLGVFFMEVLSFSIFLFFSLRIITLQVEQKFGLIALPVLSAAVLNLRSFGHGGSAEQFSLPLIAISLYFFIRYFKEVYPQPMPIAWLFLNGVAAGCVLWIKYAFLGFWVGWILTILVSQVVNKNFKLAMKSAVYFLAGMLAATLPWILYFGIHNAIHDWLYTYITINLTSYPMDLTVRERIMVPIDSLQHHLSINPLAVSLLVLGTAIYLTNRKYLRSAIGRAGLAVGIMGVVLGVYGGGRDYHYYFFIFSPLIVLGFSVLLGLYADEYSQIRSKLAFALLLLVSVAGSLAYTLRFQRNTYMLDWDRSAQVQYRYADIIAHTENVTLLNFGFLDGGFYTTSGITPNLKFFQAQNIDYSAFPLVVDEQNRYVREQSIDFIVIRRLTVDNVDSLPIPHLYENYQLIATQPQLFGETEFFYLLFERIK